ncbi:hypothetical protein [Haliscomenobacter hydrossis]|uniref:TIR domain-containing protein n=1 Tax=Haliscomenobacter hydrossis (strain ATCC 27775 / DSM 1100 / LMG 10767 / O) TaxID=760192 RepID=F4L033_HALH1|nr:hypothetical protein [Haliscomenobacter hydrossis]AEE52742.1 hypothetical protein Halhy_4913 [Haliscomenobacter hydrossis DSM 1100]
MKEQITAIQVYFYAIPPYGKQDKEALLHFLNLDDTDSFGTDFEKWIRVVQQISTSIRESGLPLQIMTDPWAKPQHHEKTVGEENAPDIVNTVSFFSAVEKDEVSKIFVLLLSAKDFSTKQGSSNADKKLTKIISYFRHTCLAQEGEEILAAHAFDYQPIITVGVEDLMNLYSDEENPGDFRRDLNLDHRIKYLDSSIWNRYLPLHCDDKNAKSFKDRFMEILGQMVTWHREGLYQSVAAVTTLEFQTRMLYNSFIAKVGEKGHNELVRPFKFHSETQMRRKANEIMNFFEADRNGVTLKAMLKWNFLLVDDQAENVPMSTINIVHSPLVTKSRLIQKILKDDFPSSSIRMEVPKQEIGIVDEMIDQLKPDHPVVFDVILLDYLLGLGKEREREYGHDFLLRLRKEPALQKGPYNRFWIFPMSSFPHAFTDKLHQLGINHLTDWWHLSNGGDPVCAPELFRYNLLEFLKQQISACFYDQVMLAEIIQKFQGIHKYEDWIESTSRAVRHMQAFRDQLRRKKGSEFCTSFVAFLDAQNDILHLEREVIGFLELLSGWGSNETIKKGIVSFRTQQPKISEAFPPLEDMLLTREKKFKIYIIYSSAASDNEYLRLLISHIDSSLRPYEFEILYAEILEAGLETIKAIEENISEANLFLVLNSSHLLALEDKNNELNLVIATGKKMIPINCRPCDIDQRLAIFEAIPSKTTFLSQLSKPRRESAMVKLVHTIKDQIKRQSTVH